MVKVPIAVCIRSVQAGVYPNALVAARSVVQKAGWRGLFTVRWGVRWGVRWERPRREGGKVLRNHLGVRERMDCCARLLTCQPWSRGCWSR